MRKSMEQRVLEIQLRRLELDIGRLEGTVDPIGYVHNSLMESEYLQHSKVNSGPEYMVVQGSSWTLNMVTQFGTFHHLAECRNVAEKNGYKGISVRFGE